MISIVDNKENISYSNFIDIVCIISVIYSYENYEGFFKFILIINV